MVPAAFVTVFLEESLSSVGGSGNINGRMEESSRRPSLRSSGPWEDLGSLVPLGFAVTDFTPAAYLRRRLQRPSREISSSGEFRT